MCNVYCHNPTRLDILGDKSSMKKRGASKKRDETTSIGRGTSREKDKPLRGERASAEKDVFCSTVNLLEMHDVNARFCNVCQSRWV